MTDNEIVKALECCGNVITSSCKDCLFHHTYNADCVRELMNNALDLINRQKAEIEARKRDMDYWVVQTRMAREQAKTAKSEAIKEFAERICKDRVSNDPVVIAVKVELAEMREKNNG